MTDTWPSDHTGKFIDSRPFTGHIWYQIDEEKLSFPMAVILYLYMQNCSIAGLSKVRFGFRNDRKAPSAKWDVPTKRDLFSFMIYGS